jgi:hypothetical protein
MTMHDIDARNRFGELVRLHTNGRRFLDREAERKLMEEGLTRYNLSFDEARGVVRAAVADSDVALEHELAGTSTELLRTLADRRGQVGRDDFEKAVAFYRARAGKRLTVAEARQRVKGLMEEADLQPARAGRLIRTRRWYRQIEA